MRRIGNWTAAVVAITFACTAFAEPLRLATRPIPLDPGNPQRRTLGALVYRGGLELASDDPRLAELSGLHVAGERLIAVTDRGDWVTARLVHDAEGRLVGLAEAEVAPLRDPRGAPVRGAWGDAEALAPGPGETLFVAFERRHRIWRYAAGPASAWAEALALPPTLAHLAPNRGVEALARLRDGRLVALAEETGEARGWLIAADGSARALAYPTGVDFRPTGAAALADDALLVLERRYTVIAGPGARLVLVAAVPGAGGRLAGHEIARLAPPLSVDNFEGVAVREAAGGGLDVFLVSDDNGRATQRTLLLQFWWRR